MALDSADGNTNRSTKMSVFHDERMPSSATSDLFASAFESNLMECNAIRKRALDGSGNSRKCPGNFRRHVSRETRFREARESKPNDPVIANNLAWVILQSAPESKDRGNAAHRLEEALALCQIATSRMPDIASFHETRVRFASRWSALTKPGGLPEVSGVGMSTEAIEAAIQRLENRGSASE